MEIPFVSEALHCSGCENEIPSGANIYVICQYCVEAYGLVEAPQLTLFELPAPSEIH